MIVRPERSADHAAIASVVEAAFGKAHEARMVEKIRASDGYVPELALVAEVDGAVVAHTMLSYVVLDDGSRRLLQLAPMAVRPDLQRQGIGSALVRGALAAAEDRDEPLVLVLGHAAYYTRFGFAPASGIGLHPPSAEIPDEVFMAVPLTTYDPRIRGRVIFPPSFE